MYVRLKELRKRNKISCSRMSKELGFANASVYNKKERGKIPIKIEEAKHIARFFKTTLDDIFLP